MKYRQLLVITLIGNLALGLFGCAATSPKESFDMLQQTDQIELEYAVPEYDISEESTVALLPWLQLSSLETHLEIRSQFENLFNITGETGNKVGDLYFNTDTQKADQNVTLFMALKNTSVRDNFLTEASMTELGNIAAEHYADVEADDLSAPYATINAYFELLPDQEAGQFDGDATISRAQAMALVMRAATPVNEAQAPETNADFTSAVGESQYTNFAAPMDTYAYINTSNGLTEGVFNSAMSRGEYIALLTNYLMESYEVTVLDDWDETELTTITDGGSEITLADAIQDPSKGLPTDLYKTLSDAVTLGIVEETALEDWDSSITKAEAIQLFIDAAINASPSTYTDEDINNGITSPEVEAANEAARREDREIDEYGNTLPFEGRTGISKFNAWAQSQGADVAMGWTFIYYNGSGAGDQPSYGVYMKEDSPLYGTVYHVGDYLPNGQQFVGTLEELAGVMSEKAHEQAEKDGAEIYTDPETGKTVIDLSNLD